MGYHSMAMEPLGGPIDSQDMRDEMPRWFLLFLSLNVAAGLWAPVGFAQYAAMGTLWLFYLSCYLYAPDRTILVFIALFPVLQLLPEGFSPVPAINFETIIVLALAAAVVLQPSDDSESKIKNPFLAPAIYYAVILFISAPLSYFTGATSKTLWQLLASVKNHLFFVFLAPISFRLLRTRNQLRAAVVLVGVMTATVSVHALWLARERFATGTIDVDNRLEGVIAWQPNLFGGFLALILVILVSMTLGTRGRSERLLYAVCSGATGMGLIYTLSRGSWLGALGGFAYLGSTRGLKVILIFLLLVSTAVIWMPSEVFERTQYTFRESRNPRDESVELEPSANARLVQWRSMPYIWIRAPLIGHGYRSYARLYKPYDAIGLARSPHSTIIALTVETGLLGLIAYGWLIWTLGRGGLRLARRAPDPFLSSLGAGFVAAVICLVLLDTTGTRFLRGNVMAYIWLLGGGVARAAIYGLPEGSVTKGQHECEPGPLPESGDRALPSARGWV